MDIHTYLNRKYGITGAKGLLACEAKIFGIPYPLKPHWIGLHGDTEITPDMESRLRLALRRHGKGSAIKGLEALGAESDSSTPGGKLEDEVAALRAQLHIARSVVEKLFVALGRVEAVMQANT
ncbi:hypothetical protein [Glaciimonas immobilis]|uniref:Uncharacterized protein n=1 Tax=Glaciimonas immobilis TaxID=728004 RepID=A0A840RW71_9BURK|nr:hypothetical protein [Glaciimonas immobilis]KAF3997511.1 hypothetical protein HAV38_12590 [Glaciimonas immobilis]MBB5200811.1 hypothetical protein [Glaciimonas immobilis]